ncbi:MAG: hypothetical protein QXK37_04590 [Candidatus Woesearchaeota archaeon]
MKRVFRAFAENIEEIILILLIILNIAEFSTKLSPELDYLDNIVDLTAMGYLFYRVSVTRIFFGRRQRTFDFLVVLAFFLLFSKTIIGYSEVARNEMVKIYLDEIIKFSEPRIIDYEDGEIININVTNTRIITTTEIGKENYLLIYQLAVEEGKKVYLNLTNQENSRIIQAGTVSLHSDMLLKPKELKLIMRTSLLYFFNYIADNKRSLEFRLFVYGGSLIFCISLFFAWFTPVTKPSLLHAIEEEGPPPRTIRKFAVRTLMVFIGLNFFFITIFNFGMEWLALAVDAPIVMILLFFYIFVWIKHHKKYPAESFIYKLGDAGESFYSRVIMLFHTRRGILLGLSGMLALHLLSDLGNFVVPYALYSQGAYDPLYFGHLGMERQPIFSIHDLFNEEKVGLIYDDLEQVQGITKVSIIYLYVANISAMIFLMGIPFLIWYMIFNGRRLSLPVAWQAIFASSIIAFIFGPVFTMGRIISNSIVGVDITVQSILSASRYDINTIMLLSISAAIVTLGLGSIKSINRRITTLIVATSLVYFAIYIFFYFMDVTSYYIAVASNSIVSSSYFAACYFLIFLMITLIFYIGGFILFLYESIEGEKENI